MEIIQLNKATKNEGVAIALGYFDGLHLGHQAIITDVVAYARVNHLVSAVMTFSINPKVFLKRAEDTGLLTPLSEKLNILRGLGVNQLLVLPFDEQMAKMEPAAFINVYLLNQQVRYVAAGPDFCFGDRGAGNIGLLKEYGKNFSVNVTPKLRLKDEKIGTTEIKAYLEKGQVGAAARMLGRPYALSGTVIKGNQKGRTIGFPTANILVWEDYMIPRAGVYAVDAIIGTSRYQGMCNIGHNPTFNFTGRLSVEVNLFDFDQDIYGCTLRLEFLHYLRSEKKFSSIEGLMEQLKRDRRQVRLLMSAPSFPQSQEVPI